MRYLAIVLCIAAIAAPAASAKGQISVTLSDSTPRVGQQFTVNSGRAGSFRQTTGFG